MWRDLMMIRPIATRGARTSSGLEQGLPDRGRDEVLAKALNQISDVGQQYEMCSIICKSSG